MDKLICTGIIYSLNELYVWDLLFPACFKVIFTEKCQFCHIKTIYKCSPNSLTCLGWTERRIILESSRKWTLTFCEPSISSFRASLKKGTKPPYSKWIRKKFLQQAFLLEAHFSAYCSDAKICFRSILTLISIPLPLDTSLLSDIVYRLNQSPGNWNISVSVLLSIHIYVFCTKWNHIIRRNWSSHIQNTSSRTSKIILLWNS